MKRIFGLLFCATLFLTNVNPNFVKANEEPLEKPREEYTLEEAEKAFLTYLNEKQLNYEMGSPEYSEYVMKLNYEEETNTELAEDPSYGIIAAYISEYTYAYETNLGMYEDSNTEESQTPEVLEAQKEEFLNALEVQKEKTIGDIEAEIEVEEEKQEGIPELEFSTYSTYSVSKAKAYAKKWYNSRNSYQYQSQNNDCTNFVSQILFAGGKSKKKPSPVPASTSNTKYWYSYMNDSGKVPTFKKSTSWINVSDFYAFWSKTQSTKSSTSKKTLISYADVGDVIQFKKDEATRYSHSMFVYEKSNGTLYLSGHTSNYLKRNFKKIDTRWVKYRVIKF
ncbi:amidase domain-containing protein [Peribacillus sp. NPDC096622]|uniref:amidase domain-containing protein n=1 Tax=Peribacillus sp. NPDC096622 TaxID=3364396 RepID=UPI00381124CC